MVTVPRRGAVALASAAATVVVGALLPATPASAQTGPSDVQNMILLIGDGMGRTHVTAARERFYGARGRLEMERSAVVGQVATWAVEEGSDKPELVTDSASSATAWSSGVKTYNAALGVDTKGRIAPTLMEQAKQAGMRTGNVSTAEVTDATPAAMMSHVLLRGCQGPVFTPASCLGNRATPTVATTITPVAEQVARNGVADIILGGGLARFEPDDEQALRAQGYQVLGSFGDPALQPGQQTAATQRVATRGDLDAVNAPRVVGLFNRGNMTVETTKAATNTAVIDEPSLPEMTRKAISLLDGRTDRGFFLQVEGALIDKRSHANDATQTLGEMKAYDDAARVAFDYAARDGNTLVIVTADHECAGFNIIEPGTFTNAEALNFPGTGNVDTGNPANNSTPVRAGRQQKDPARSTAPNNAAGSTTGNFAAATFRTPDDPAEVRDGDPRASLWLSYLSGNHTGADVPLYARGPESGRFAGTQDNTDLYRKMYASLRALGNERTTAPSPLRFRTIVQGRGAGTAVVAVNDVASPQPGARVDVYHAERGRQRFVRRLQLNARGTTTVAPAVFRFRRGTQQTFVVRVVPRGGTAATTVSQPVTTFVS